MITGWPDTSTRGKGATGVAWPACEHNTVAPRWSTGAGMVIQLAVCQTIVNAPALMSVVGPSMVITAPLPLLIVMPMSLTEIIAPVVV